MNDDLISRSALLEEINGDENKKADVLMYEWYADMVKRQPTAYDVNKVVERSTTYCGEKWIHCGDGNNLPEPGRRYRVTALWKDGDFETRSVYDLVYGTDGLWHGENYIPVSFEIIAWKPLEEPYKENIEEHVRKSVLGVAQMSDRAWAAYRKEQRAIRKGRRK